MIRGLHAVLTAVWQSGTIPPDWKRRLVVPIWKGKGDRQDCNNYHGITLLSVPGKVLAHLLLTRIRSHLVKHQRPQQSGFTPGKSTTDRILALRVLVERRREFRQGMLAANVDLKKAFDPVHRESLWDLLRLRGIPARTIDLITGLYSGTESAMKCGAGVSSFFPVNTGVRQGCVLAPSLFNACMDWVLDKVVDQRDCGASIGNTKITDLVFADDAVIFAESLEVLVMALEALHEEAKPLGLEVSWLKTKVQVFEDLLDEAVQTVHACGEDIEILESFTYIGSAVHNDGGSRQEVLRRIGIAHGVMDSLSGSIWRCRYLRRRTRIRIFKSLVISVLLYGCAKMSGRMVAVLVATTLVLLLTETQAIVVGPQPLTYAPDFGNCSESIKLVPEVRLMPPETTPLSPTSYTLPPPRTTPQPLYTQPHGTTPPTTTTQHPNRPSPLTPTPHSKTDKTTTLQSKKHTTSHGKQHDKHDKLDKTQNSLNTNENKSPSFWHFLDYMIFPATTSTSASSSSTSTIVPPPPYVTVPQPSLAPRTSTLPPPSPSLPLPSIPPPPSPTPTLMLTLQEIEERMNRLLKKQIPGLAQSSGWTTEFQKPYSQRIKAVNHELVDKILQTDYEDIPAALHENTSACHLPESRLSLLLHKQTLLFLLLQALPQSLKEVEDAAHDPEITDYIFRPEKKAVFDVHTCRQCYALDANGVCREVFFCKNGQDVFSRVSRRRAIVG
ncbi:Retrovirus-related Pol polyprotein from type-2 retrotransposable element R2DM [Chionoecetes opilio]|uniref:Retrovirus-related Pol polyprotein from type-2 retrotransposable element R2DM n=1 Tax=Chionoecetes opilio TaxID=41210 RepID=A0A8J5CS93_CHIOP|nr:Retrovirus-related Pol polyprotein from type-2 retrotransposable element R2DM [Chionoecetes opilio]